MPPDVSCASAREGVLWTVPKDVMSKLVLGPLLRYVGETDATVWVETDQPCEVERSWDASRARSASEAITTPCFMLWAWSQAVLASTRSGSTVRRFGQRQTLHS